MPSTWLDHIDIRLLGIVIVVLLAGSGELGFHAASRLGKDSEKSLTSVLSAALLGLLGLLLAFCFSIVADRFAARKMLVVEEANAIHTTYLRAGMLPAPHAEHTRALLRDYLELRIGLRSEESYKFAVVKARALQRQLWHGATQVGTRAPDSEMLALFVSSLNETFDLQQKRITVGLHHRLPFAMLLTLIVVAVLSMLVHGYGAGLDRCRTALPTLTLVVSISAVLLVIVELDRPWQHMFQVSQDALVSVREEMSR